MKRFALLNVPLEVRSIKGWIISMFGHRKCQQNDWNPYLCPLDNHHHFWRGPCGSIIVDVLNLTRTTGHSRTKRYSCTYRKKSCDLKTQWFCTAATFFKKLRSDRNDLTGERNYLRKRSKVLKSSQVFKKGFSYSKSVQITVWSW